MLSASRATGVLTAVCALALTGCSPSPEDEEEHVPFPASAISPDAVVTCAETGDCDQDQAVRWSRPLEGDFYLERFEEEAPALRPAGHWLDVLHPLPGVLEDDGTLYLYNADTITAVATADGERLWRRSLDHHVEGLEMVGSTLMVDLATHRDDGHAFLLLDADGDAPAREPDLPENFEHRGVSAFDDTHLVLRESRGHDDEGDPLYLSVEAATGEVAWSTTSPEADAHALLDGDLYLRYASEDDPGHVTVLTDGEQTAEFQVPEEAGNAPTPWPAPDGPLLLNTPDCAPFAGDCDGERITAVDPADGRVLWTHPVPGGLLSLTEGPEGPRARVHDEDGHHTLDARTGEVLTDATAPGEGQERLTETLEEFGARSEEPTEGMSPAEYDMLQLRPTGPGVDADPFDDLAVGAEHLAAVPGPEGEVVGVYYGCAPDGLRPPSLDAPTGANPCVAPRLFTVDYRVDP